VTSELVTNCVLHAGLQPTDVVEVRVWCGSRILVEVEDWGKGFKPAPAGARGRPGLDLVEAVSTRFGIRRTSGTVVWAKLARDAPVGAVGGGAARPIA